MRRFASRVFNQLVRTLFGLPYSDTQCGAKLFRTEAFRRVFSVIETANFAFDVDLLYQLKRCGCSVVEAPTVWNNVAGSKVKLLKSSWTMLVALLRLRLRHSVFRLVIPFFDRIIPTAPMQTHERISILILNWRDVAHPAAGGAEAYLHEMARRWVTAGHRVEWLTSGFPGCKRNAEIDGVRVTRVGSSRSVYAVLPIEYLRNFRDRFDIIVDSENGIPFFSPLFSFKPKALLMFHVHRRMFLSELRFPLSWLLVWLEGFAMPFVYRNVPVVTISEDTRQEIQRYGLSRQSIEIVRPGVSESYKPGVKSRKPRVVYLGRLKNQKRLHLLIQAMERVRTALPNATLAIAGSGDAEPKLRSLVERLHLEDCVSFLGYVSEAEKQRVLSSAWVFVTPSVMEGWGMSVIEANACGTPAIAFSVPGLREAVKNGITGILVDEGHSLAAAIIKLLVDDGLRFAMEREAVAHAKEFSWARASQEMLNILAINAVVQPFGLVQNQGQWNLVTRSASKGQSRLHSTQELGALPAMPETSS